MEDCRVLRGAKAAAKRDLTTIDIFRDLQQQLAKACSTPRDAYDSAAGVQNESASRLSSLSCDKCGKAA